MSAGVIAAIVIAPVVALAATIGFILYLRKSSPLPAQHRPNVESFNSMTKIKN